MHFVFGSITTAFAKARYAQDALGAQEKKGRVNGRKGCGDYWEGGTTTRLKWKAGQKGLAKFKQEWDKNTSAFF